MNETDRRQANALIARGWSDQAMLQRLAETREAAGLRDLCEALLARRLIAPELAATIRRAADPTTRPSSRINARPNRVAPRASSAMIRVGSGARPSGAGWSPPSSTDGSQAWKAEQAWTAPEAFELFEELGRGAMGVVYKARERSTGRQVALKFIQGQADEDDIKRFRREALTLVRLKHPRLVEIVDVSFDSTRPFIALEFVEGQSLSAAIDDTLRVDGELPGYEQINWILEDLADALVYCHEQGVIHRDVKPQNIVLDDAVERAVLIDFGLLKRASEGGELGRSLSLTGTRDMVGTPAFMSPEQFFPKGEFGEVGPASDVWGFGATLFYVLTGAPPFPQPTALEIALAMKDGATPRLEAARPDAPPWLCALCADCFQLQADARPSMAAVRDRLLAGPPTSPSRLRPAALLATALFLAVSITVYSLSGGDPGPREPAPATPPVTSPEPARAISLAEARLTFENKEVAGRLLLGENSLLVGKVSGVEGVVEVGLKDGAEATKTDGEGRFELFAPDESGPLVITLDSGSEQRDFQREAMSDADYRGAREALADLGSWDRASDVRQDLAIALVSSSLAAGFVHAGTERHAAGGQQHRIARFRYQPGDLDFLLIPGGKVRARWISRFDYADELVKLEAMLSARPPTAELMRAVRVVFGRNWNLLTDGIKAANRVLTRDERAVIVEFIDALRSPEKDFEDSPERRAGVFGALAKSLDAQKLRYVVESEEELPAFLISRTELTVNQGRGIIGSKAKAEGGDAPVVHGRPEDSEARLEQAGGRFRLPYRLELQYAMAGGTSLREGWFDDLVILSERVWHRENSGNRGREAAEHAGKSNPFGLIDGLGNHPEWSVLDLDRWAEVLDASGLEFPEFWLRMARMMRIPTGGERGRFTRMAKESRSWMRYALLGGRYDDPAYLLRPSLMRVTFRIGGGADFRKMFGAWFGRQPDSERDGGGGGERDEGAFRLVYPLSKL